MYAASRIYQTVRALFSLRNGDIFFQYKDGFYDFRALKSLECSVLPLV